MSYLHRFIMRRLSGCPIDAPICNKKDSEAPDYSQIAAANKEAAQLAKQASDADLAFRKQTYSDLLPYIQNQLEAGKSASELQAEIAKSNQTWAESERSRKAEVFQPIEEKMAQESMDYGSAADQERTALDAGGAVDSSYAGLRDANTRAMTSMGINPNSGKFVSSSRAMDIAQAGQKAAAMSGARTQARDKGIALRAGAANYSQGLGNTASNAYNTSVGAGSASANSAGAGVGTGLAGANYVSGGYGQQMNAQNMAIQGNLGLGSLQNQGYSISSQANANEMSGLGSMLGAGASLFFSSEDLKENGRTIDGEAVLEAIDDIPVEEWNYKKGVADEGRHIGPYAGDVQEKFGDKAAPGGIAIDAVTMNGLNMKAIQTLSQKIKRLEKSAGLADAKRS